MDNPSQPYVRERVWPVSDAPSKAPPAFDPKHAREEMTPEKQWCGPLNVNNLPPQAPKLPWGGNPYLQKDDVGNSGYTRFGQPSPKTDEEWKVYDQHNPHVLQPELTHVPEGPILGLPEITTPSSAENALLPKEPPKVLKKYAREAVLRRLQP